MGRRRRAIIATLGALVVGALVGVAVVHTPVDIRPGTMDAADTHDPSLDDPQWLLSARNPAPSADDQQRPVIISAHGFQASTHEWVEFQRYAEARGVLFSNVLLGGHGRSTEAWSRSTWRAWGAPVVEEYRRLSALGYERLNVFCSSTGCTLWFNSLAEGQLHDVVPAKNLVMVAPLIVPHDPLLYLAPWVGPVLGNLPSAQTEREEAMFYHNRPYPVFVQLLEAITAADKALAEGRVELPAATRAYVFRARGETTVSPESGARIVADLVAPAGVSLEEVNSRHHIFTRKAGRKQADTLTAEERALGLLPWTDDDERIYQQTFAAFMGILAAEGTGAVP